MGLFSIFSKKNNDIKKETTEDKKVVSENELNQITDKENENDKSVFENDVVSAHKT